MGIDDYFYSTTPLSSGAGKAAVPIAGELLGKTIFGHLWNWARHMRSHLAIEAAACSLCGMDVLLHSPTRAALMSALRESRTAATAINGPGAKLRPLDASPPLHQCWFHMSQMMSAVLASGAHTLKLVSSLTSDAFPREPLKVPALHRLAVQDSRHGCRRVFACARAQNQG